MANIISSETVGGHYVYPHERFTFDDGTIVKVEQDGDSDSPLEWGHDVVAYVHRSRYRMSLPDCDSGRDVIARAFAEYVHSARRVENEDDLLKRAIRYARVFHGDTRVAQLHSFQGYRRGDWAEIVFIGPDAETVSFIAENYAGYFRGDVYCAWTGDDSRGGIYADSAEDAAKYFHDETMGN